MSTVAELEAAVHESHGELDLSFRRDAGGRTVLRSRHQRFPLRMTVPFHLDSAAPGMAYVYVQNPTGGVFAGDRLRTSVGADERAQVHLTTQSATKLYRMDDGEARHELSFELEAGAYVEHMPDPLIPQAGTRYRQATRVEIAPSAAFVAAETVGPGRRAHGERFQYDLLELRTEVRSEGRELCVETIRLEPWRARPDRPGALGDSDYLVTLIAVAPDHDAAALAGVVDRALAKQSYALGAAGELPNRAGAVARILAGSGPDAERALHAAWAAVRRELLGVPPPATRK